MPLWDGAVTRNDSAPWPRAFPLGNLPPGRYTLRWILVDGWTAYLIDSFQVMADPDEAVPPEVGPKNGDK